MLAASTGSGAWWLLEWGRRDWELKGRVWMEKIGRSSIIYSRDEGGELREKSVVKMNYNNCYV